MIQKKTKEKKTETKSKLETALIGKAVIVRANVAGVHAGIIECTDFATQAVTLTNAYRLWRVYTRDKSGSISDIAANGLKPNGGHSIGACQKRLTVVNPQGLELAELTDDAYESIQQWKN
jgi:hypothetical protein